ncbi:carcinoembryonic antigen-related cell adhesion molecule 1-like isoform X1 [Monodelphis domestica]|uniref:Immunoglobulin superfamily member 23 n=1 Tax=Monodelphis domestica TaxID=13616 RepID=F6QG81_MONDO|nr:carcinoembryonic antigen-related cell adhesion molecule 1-like isoform X1 [Monodelphis domestica]
MELSRDHQHGCGSPWKRFLLIAILLSFWTHPGFAEIFINTVPTQPMEGGNMLLIALNTPDDILNATWYSWFRPWYPAMIVSCIPTNRTGPCAQVFSPAHTTRKILTHWNILEIRNLTLSDTGFYSLLLDTESGPRNASTYIKVKQADDSISKPKISANTTVPVAEIDSVVFTCHTNATNVKILWFNGGVLLSGGERLQLSSDNRTLTILRVTLGDQGLYYCRVENNLTSATSDTIQLTVNYSPSQIFLFTHPTRSYENVITSDLNYSVVLNCEVSGSPSPLVFWFFNGTECWNRSVYVIQRLSPKDLGNYFCMARNSVGQQTSPSIQVRLPQDNSDIEPIEPDPIYSLSGAPAICLTVAGIAGIIFFIGGMTYSVLNRKSVRKGKSQECGCI